MPWSSETAVLEGSPGSMKSFLLEDAEENGVAKA